jgi:hypothetical protein
MPEPANPEAAQPAKIDEWTYERLFISRTGTFHVERNPAEPQHGTAWGRVVAVCGFSIRPADHPVIPRNPAAILRDCKFCLEELAAIERRAPRLLLAVVEAPIQPGEIEPAAEPEEIPETFDQPDMPA